MICCAGYHHHHYAIQLSAALPFSASPLCALPPPARPHQRASRARPAAAARISSTLVMHSDPMHASFILILWWPRVPRRSHNTSHTRARQSIRVCSHPRLRDLPSTSLGCRPCSNAMCATAKHSNCPCKREAPETALKARQTQTRLYVVPPEPPFRDCHTNQPPRFCNLKHILDSHITLAQ